MQNLRRIRGWFLLTVLTLFLFGTGVSWAGTIRVTTWNLQWFPSGSSFPATPQKQEENIKAAARVITIINPDVLLLQEIQDWDTCQRLADALAPLKYQVLVCSAFRDEFGGGVGRQQVAILAKKHAQAAWSQAWTTKGVIDPPRGYAFAVIRYGNKDIGVYSLHLKSNLVRGNNPRQREINILKRELAAEQLVAHSGEVAKSFPKGIQGFVVGGDFNTNRDEFVSERTLGIFEKAGFIDPFATLPLPRRVTHPSKGRFPDATFDYVLSKGLRQLGKPEILKTKASDHYPVTSELELP